MPKAWRVSTARSTGTGTTSSSTPTEFNSRSRTSSQGGVVHLGDHRQGGRPRGRPQGATEAHRRPRVRRHHRRWRAQTAGSRSTQGGWQGQRQGQPESWQGQGRTGRAAIHVLFGHGRRRRASVQTRAPTAVLAGPEGSGGDPRAALLKRQVDEGPRQGPSVQRQQAQRNVSAGAVRLRAEGLPTVEVMLKRSRLLAQPLELGPQSGACGLTARSSASNRPCASSLLNASRLRALRLFESVIDIIRASRCCLVDSVVLFSAVTISASGTVAAVKSSSPRGVVRL